MASPTNLYEYYSSQGQALPTVQARQTLATQAGIQGYSGTAQQNTQLLGYLTSQGGNNSSTPATSATNIGTQPYQVPTPTPVPNVSTEIQSAYNQAQTSFNQAQAGVDAVQTQRDQLKSDYQILSDQLINQTADTQTQEQAQGLPQLSKDYQDLINTSRTQTAKYIQGIVNSETNGGLAGNVNAQQNFLNRQNAVDSMLTNSLISAKQGDITNAQAQVDRAITLKYDPIKQQIQNKMQFLELNYQDLSRADQKLADAKTKQWNMQMKQIGQLHQTEKELNDMIILAAQNDAPVSVLNNAKAIKDKGGSSTKVALALGKYGGDYLKQELLKEQIKTEKAQRANINSQISARNTETASGGTGKAPTQAQFTAAGYATRVIQSKDVIDQNIDEIAKLSASRYLYQRKLPNILQSSLVQQQLQAERNFVNSVLRRESGAAIAQSEFDSAAKQYFPMPGDSAEVLAQKKANRDLTSQNLINESGNAYQASNPFAVSLGQSSEAIGGTSILSIGADGTLQFNIPKK